MSKATAFEYRSNPKAIANYLNDALATDDSAFVRALGNLARTHGMGPLPKRRT
jgi:DNA-binding phage protein